MGSNMNFTARLKIEIMYFLLISILTSLLDSSSGLNYLVNDLLLFVIFVVAAILLAKIFLNHHFFDIKEKLHLIVYGEKQTSRRNLLFWDYVWSKIDNQYAMDSTIPNKKAVN